MNKTASSPGSLLPKERANGSLIARFNAESSILRAIDIGLQGATHHFDRSGFAGPDFEGAHTLVKEHAKAVGDPTTGFAGGAQKRRFGGPIDHVIDRGGCAQ